MTTCFCLTDYGNFVIGHKGAEGARGADGPRGNQHNWSMHSAKLNYAGIPCHNVELLLCQLSLMGKGPMEIPNEDKPGGVERPMHTDNKNLPRKVDLL